MSFNCVELGAADLGRALPGGTVSLRGEISPVGRRPAAGKAPRPRFTPLLPRVIVPAYI